MKVIFIGPSLHGAEARAPAGAALRPPAAKGDLYRAVEEGADVIGLVDGYFEATAAVWHKEILHALSCGVRMFGAASIGALRAAECAAFGMTGIGAIYEAYANGQLEDDSEVALLHAPKELAYLPLSEPLVNVRATLNHLLLADLIAEHQSQALITTASSIFYKERTWRMILAAAALSPDERMHISGLVRTFRVDQKMIDAVALLKAVELEADARSKQSPAWDFSHTSYFQTLAT
ncbi:TfuA-like protein [Pleomorphomonas sp. PLEO]|uniref:TfuA-like protein n=1 Tax=Pleomorphomonas sp. PLEO TaxID=3239306 RepID=UPI00351E7458